MDITLQQRDLKPLGFDMRAYCTGAGGSYIFLQCQYELHRDGVHCKAEVGDVVIDAGACWGETSLYFAHEVGKEGKVFAFEFIPSNLDVLRKNIAANPHLSNSINVVDLPLWDQDGQVLYYVDWGPGSRVSFEKLREDFADTQCTTTTIDHVVGKFNAPRVDFIKMDIEGAELKALKGAEKTILRFHPKMAISLYHSIDDFKTIPRYLNLLGLSYKYYLDHHTIYENETVLFAIPQQ
jgi:FkbM family methyltransferase